MKISVDALPLVGRAGGKVYTENLLNSFLKYDNFNSYNLVFRKWNMNLSLYRRKYNSLNFKVSKILIPNRILEYLWTFNDFKIYADFLYGNPEIYLNSTYFLPNFKKTKIVSVVYDITTLKFEKYFKHKMDFLIRMKNIIKKSSTIVAISEYTKKDFCDYFKIDCKRVNVIYPSVSDNFKPLCKEETVNFLRLKNLRYGEYFLYVGNISYHKNIKRLCEAFLKLKIKNIDLVLCGSAKWGKDIIKEIKSKDKENRIKVMEDIKDLELSYIYNGCLAFFYVSLFEGFGLPVLEAMKCGRPVIVSNSTSLPEVVGDCAIKVDPLSVDDILSAMNFIIDRENNLLYSKKAIYRAGFFNDYNMFCKFTDIFNSLV